MGEEREPPRDPWEGGECAGQLEVGLQPQLAGHPHKGHGTSMRGVVPPYVRASPSISRHAPPSRVRGTPYRPYPSRRGGRPAGFSAIRERRGNHKQENVTGHRARPRANLRVPPRRDVGIPPGEAFSRRVKRKERGKWGKIKGGGLGGGRGREEVSEWGDVRVQLETNKTLVKVLAQDPWRHQVLCSRSQRVLFLNELKSHLPLSCSIHQATSRESLT